jgi:hypothetical protein
MRDRINLVNTDTPFTFDEHLDLIGRYADELKTAADEALDEEAILVAVFKVQHAE